jgi:predicted RNA-binding Zn-ribbon protein involved in translation (DUF1610 family)
MSKEYICTACGHVGDSKTVFKGHFLIELVLWLCFIVPGLIYTIWRRTSTFEACPTCGNPNLLPAHSPMARKFLAENPALRDAAVVISEPARPPSGAAKAAGRAIGRLVGRALRKLG